MSGHPARREFIEELALPALPVSEDIRSSGGQAQTTSYGKASGKPKDHTQTLGKGRRLMSGKGISIQEEFTEGSQVERHAVGRSIPADAGNSPLIPVHDAQQVEPQGPDEVEPYTEPSVSPSSSPMPTKELFSSVNVSETSSHSWTAIDKTDPTKQFTPPSNDDVNSVHSDGKKQKQEDAHDEDLSDKGLSEASSKPASSHDGLTLKQLQELVQSLSSRNTQFVELLQMQKKEFQKSMLALQSETDELQSQLYALESDRDAARDENPTKQKRRI